MWKTREKNKIVSILAASLFIASSLLLPRVSAAISPSARASSFTMDWQKLPNLDTSSGFTDVLISANSAILTGWVKSSATPTSSSVLGAQYGMDGSTVFGPGNNTNILGSDQFEMGIELAESGGNVQCVYHQGWFHPGTGDEDQDLSVITVWGINGVLNVPRDLFIDGTSYYVCGYVWLGAEKTGLVVKFNDSVEAWNATFTRGSDVLFNRLLVKDGVLYAAGSIFNTITFSRDVIIVKYWTNGTFISSTLVGQQARDEECTGFVQSGNSFYISGYCNDSTKKQEVFLVKLDAGLAETWRKTWGGAENEFGRDLATYGSDAYIVGETFSGTTDPVWDSQGFIVKFDGDGNLLGSTTWGTSAADNATGIALSGNAVVCSGFYKPVSGHEKPSVVKYTVVDSDPTSPGPSVNGPPAFWLIISLAGGMFTVVVVYTRKNGPARKFS